MSIVATLDKLRVVVEWVWCHKVGLCLGLLLVALVGGACGVGVRGSMARHLTHYSPSCISLSCLSRLFHLFFCLQSNLGVVESLVLVLWLTNVVCDTPYQWNLMMVSLLEVGGYYFASYKWVACVDLLCDVSELLMGCVGVVVCIMQVCLPSHWERARWQPCELLFLYRGMNVHVVG